MGILGPGNFIHRYGNTPQTQAVVSTRSKILVTSNGATFEQVGVLSKFDVDFDRDVQEVAGIGYGDMIAELVPNRQKAIKLSVERTAFYLMGIFQAFGYKGGVEGLVRSLRHHRWPFDIKQELVFSEALPSGISAPQMKTPDSPISGDPEYGKRFQALITLYESCWMTSYRASYAVDNSVVNESVNISCIDMVDANLKRGPGEAESDHGGYQDASLLYQTKIKGRQ